MGLGPTLVLSSATPPFYRNIQEDGESIEVAQMDAECRKEDGWLYTEERFLRLKKLAERGKIALIAEYILNTKHFEAIHALIRLHCSLIYPFERYFVLS